MDWRVVEAGPGDAALVAGVVGELLGEIMAATGRPHFHFDEEATRARTADFLGRGIYRTFMAWPREGIRPAGMINLTESHALYAGGAFGLIPEFFVRPEWRSRGVGRGLLEAARRLGRSLGWDRLEVTTPPLPDFQRTYAFYEREGFAVSGGRKMKMDL